MVWIDEILFTSNTVPKKAYERRNLQIIVEKKEFTTKVVHLVAAISEEKGLEAWLLLDRPVNQFSFCSIIPKIKRNGARFVLAGDNCKIHLSRYSEERYRAHNSRFIALVPWESELNPIEVYFLAIKTVFKLFKLNQIIQKKKKPHQLIREAMRAISQVTVRRIAEKGYYPVWTSVQHFLKSICRIWFDTGSSR